MFSLDAAIKKTFHYPLEYAKALETTGTKEISGK